MEWDLLLPFVKQLVQHSCAVIRDKKAEGTKHTLKYVDDRLLSMPSGLADIRKMFDVVLQMLAIATDAFDTEHPERLPELKALENRTDEMKREFSAMHFSRLSEGHCSLEVSPYFTSAITGLERVADHIVNVGYSICNPTGDDDDNN